MPSGQTPAGQSLLAPDQSELPVASAFSPVADRVLRHEVVEQPVRDAMSPRTAEIKCVFTGRLYLRDRPCKGYTGTIGWSDHCEELKCFNIRKRILTDEANRPVAVQIDEQDWCKIEEALAESQPKPATDLARHIGKLDWPLDGMDSQHSARASWT